MNSIYDLIKIVCNDFVPSNETEGSVMHNIIGTKSTSYSVGIKGGNKIVLQEEDDKYTLYFYDKFSNSVVTAIESDCVGILSVKNMAYELEKRRFLEKYQELMSQSEEDRSNTPIAKRMKEILGAPEEVESPEWVQDIINKSKLQ